MNVPAQLSRIQTERLAWSIAMCTLAPSPSLAPAPAAAAAGVTEEDAEEEEEEDRVISSAQSRLLSTYSIKIRVDDSYLLSCTEAGRQAGGRGRMHSRQVNLTKAGEDQLGDHRSMAQFRSNQPSQHSKESKRGEGKAMANMHTHARTHAHAHAHAHAHTRTRTRTHIRTHIYVEVYREYLDAMPLRMAAGFAITSLSSSATLAAACCSARFVYQTRVVRCVASSSVGFVVCYFFLKKETILCRMRRTHQIHTIHWNGVGA